jgi:DNA-binding MarR family transcriptional regulator
MSSPPPASHLTSHLAYWLRYVSNHVSHAFARKLGQEGVTVAEWVILRELYDQESAAPSSLAQQLGLTRGAISKLADRLLAKGFISREDSLEDRRAHTLALTSAGRDLVPVLSALADENDAEFFDHLSEADRRTIERIMKGVIERRGLKEVPVS